MATRLKVSVTPEQISAAGTTKTKNAIAQAIRSASGRAASVQGDFVTLGRKSNTQVAYLPVKVLKQISKDGGTLTTPISFSLTVV